MASHRLAAIALAVFVLASGAAVAVEPDERLADPALEARARAISSELRCLVCQNQSIDDSSAPLARDLRLLVRDRLKAGSSDADVMRFVVDRYGTFVLLRPRFEMQTLVLWLTPFVLLLLVLSVLWRNHRAQSAAAVAGGGISPPLSADEKKRLDRILAGDLDR